MSRFVQEETFDKGTPPQNFTAAVFFSVCLLVVSRMVAKQINNNTSTNTGEALKQNIEHKVYDMLVCELKQL